jgi:nucleolar protein 56
MRLKEWFSWHFPELTKIVNDNAIFAKLTHFIENRDGVTEENRDAIAGIVLDEEKASQIIEAAKTSMGTDLRDEDCLQIKRWAERVVGLIEFREALIAYLKDRMSAVAPNLGELIGEQVGSKLIAHAGSLTNLAKYPASTIQILGAEKALFRALKTKGKTPKYGLIFNSTFIGRAAQKNKGKISRYLANKCAIAARVDCFSEAPTKKFGAALKEQIEERLKFVASGTKPRKNKEAMAEVIDELKNEGLFYGDVVPKNAEDLAAGNNSDAEDVTEDKKRDKKSKDKKSKSDKKDKKEEKEKKDKSSKKRERDSDDSSEEEKPKKKHKSKK